MAPTVPTATTLLTSLLLTATALALPTANTLQHRQDGVLTNGDTIIGDTAMGSPNVDSLNAAIGQLDANNDANIAMDQAVAQVENSVGANFDEGAAVKGGG